MALVVGVGVPSGSGRGLECAANRVQIGGGDLHVLAVTSLPSWVQSRRAGRIAPVIEPVGEVLISAALIWVAFFGGGDGLHSAGWVFVAVMMFAAIEAFYGRLVFKAQTSRLEIENSSPLAAEERGMARTYWILAGVDLGLAAIVVFLLTRYAVADDVGSDAPQGACERRGPNNWTRGAAEA